MLRAALLAAVLVVIPTAAYAEEYHIPSQSFVEINSTTGREEWSGKVMPADNGRNIQAVRNAVVLLPIPHFRVFNGLSVTIHGRFTRTSTIMTSCRLSGASTTGTGWSGPLVTKTPTAGTAFSISMSITQAQLRDFPFLRVVCTLEEGTYVHGTVLTFDWPLI